MKFSESSKWSVFVVLISLIVISLYFSSNSRPVQTSTSRNPQPRKAPVAGTAEVPLMQMLAFKAPFFRDVKRNIFHFRDDDQPEITAAPKIETPPVVTAAPSLPDVRYLGFYKQKDESRILLAAISNGGKIYVGGVGEILADKYEVLQIDDDFLVLRILGTNQVMRFDLGKTETNPTVQ
jgi:hypothetical protein